MDDRIEKLNQVIRGWINYYRMGSMRKVLTRIDERLRTRMRIVIWKQWKKSEKRYWGLRKLGAPEWMTKQSVGFGDHYQAAAKTTGLHLISKEILAKARTSQLCRLVSVGLNRCMPNDTYGGVKGASG